MTIDEGLVRKIAVLSKNHRVLRTINDMFIFAGAKPDWKLNSHPRNIEHGSQRMDRVYEWVEGLRRNAPSEANNIVEGVVKQLIEDEDIPKKDRSFLRRRLDLGEEHLPSEESNLSSFIIPEEVDDLLGILINGLPRAMFPLKHRRKDQKKLAFDNEYDVQALFHAVARPWIEDIRAEEYTPSYAGSSTRIDFLLPDYSSVVEIKYVRDKSHARKIGQELTIDIAHYRRHQNCRLLYAAVYDPQSKLENPAGLRDLEGTHSDDEGSVDVRLFVLSA